MGTPISDSDSSNPTADPTIPSGDDFTIAKFDSSAAVHEAVGSQIGPYKLLQRIGEGGFGSVFLAEQHKPVHRRVALKVIKLGMDTRQVVARFEQERQALAILDHPNIAKVFDAGSTETGRPYFVMELCTGQPIDEYCDKKRLSIEQRLELFSQVCLAVQHAHSKGLIHRDIKPSNVLVSTQDDKPLAKVIDFGIAKATAAKLTERTLFTEHKGLIGTPEYMSPEQAEGSLDIDTRTDIYALGVMMYELLTGSTPFSSKELRSVAYAEIQRIIREVDPPRPSTRLSQNSDTLANVAASRHTEPRRLSSTVRGELDWIVMKCLEKDPTRRYETANGLAMDVRRYLGGEAVLAAPPGVAYRMRKFVRRHRVAVVAGSAVAASLVLGIVAFAWQARIARDQRDRARLAEAQARQRATELQQVSDYQQKILQQVDVTAAGIGLVSDILARHDAALEKLKTPESERSARATTFERELRAINSTDTAIAFLDRTVLAPAARTINTQFADQPVVDAALRTTLGIQYQNLGRYDEALALYQKAYELRAKNLGEDNRDTLLARGGVGLVQGDLQQLAEAEATIRATVAGLQRVLGDDATETLDAKAVLATQMALQGKYEECEAITRDVLTRRERLQGPEHPVTLRAKADLARTLTSRGQYADAAKMLRQVVEIQRRVDEVSLTESLNYLGVALIRQRELAAAEPCLREFLKRRQTQYGEDHPYTISAASTLASLLMDLDQLPEAETLARDSLAKLRRVRGNEHSDTLKTMNVMGQVLFRQNKFAETEVYYREALETGRRVLGPDHPDTIIWTANMGSVLQRLGRMAEAEPYFREALDANRRVMGETHPYTRTMLKNLTDILRRQNKNAEAEALYRTALENHRRIEGEDHPETVNLLGALGSVLRDEGKLEEAESCFNQALEKSRRVNGDEHATTITAILRVASVQVAQGKYTEAIALVTPLEGKVLQAIPGPTGVLRHASLLGLLGRARAGLAKQPADFAAAEANLLEAHATFARNRGEQDKETRDWTQALADFYAAWDKADPGKGYDAKAADWKARLNAPRSTSAPATREIK